MNNQFFCFEFFFNNVFSEIELDLLSVIVFEDFVYFWNFKVLELDVYFNFFE